MNLIAQIISILSNPAVLSIPASYALVFRTSGDALYSAVWTVVSLIFTGAIVIYVLYGIGKGIFSDFDVSVREERKPLFIFTAVIAVLYLLVIFFLNGPKILMVTLGALLLGVFMDSIINKRIKASVHLAVFTSFSLVLAILFGGAFWIFPVFAPVVAWSRIKLKRHRLSETVIGTLIGVFLVIVIYLVVQYLLGIK
ncbi:MAG: hypothetical protein A2776_00760 [Candidatus Levybacteria bacterium RIFCSPHIGHO2_01_FULL_40_10]|nr:MAG: hypothetical protein A2776_00760 [Candidatus Levybacteria bacterium RIFCSPHIGHO2_01_FULL_40_10]